MLVMMPIIVKLVPRRGGAWVQAIPDEGAAVDLPVEHAPEWLELGRGVSAEQWAELAREAAYHLLLHRALNILGRREHFEMELRRKLAQRERDAGTVERVLAECRRLGYLDDARAARICAEQLAGRGGVGTPRIKSELYRRGCPGELIAPAVAEVAGLLDEAAEVQALLERRQGHFRAKLQALWRKAAQKQPDARRRAYEVQRQFSVAVSTYLAHQGLLGDEAREAAGVYISRLLAEGNTDSGTET